MLLLDCVVLFFFGAVNSEWVYHENTAFYVYLKDGVQFTEAQKECDDLEARLFFPEANKDYVLRFIISAAIPNLKPYGEISNSFI